MDECMNLVLLNYNTDGKIDGKILRSANIDRKVISSTLFPVG